MRAPALIGLAIAAASLPAASGVAQSATTSPTTAEQVELTEELVPGPPTKERSFAARLVVRTDVRAAPPPWSAHDHDAPTVRYLERRPSGAADR